MATAHNKRQALAIVRDPDVQTSAIRPAVAETCSPVLATFEALAVGATLQTLAREMHMPADVAATYQRVGEQLEAAARLAMKGGGR